MFVFGSVGETVKVLSVNCQGLRDKLKRIDVIQYLKNTNASIICLQDTHLIETDQSHVSEIWGHEVIIHSKRTNSRRVAILLNNFEYNIDIIMPNTNQITIQYI